MKNRKNKIYNKVTLLILLILTPIILNSCGYNTLVSLDENIKQQFGQVQAAYQRRADLIPNLVATVKGYATHERETLTEVVQARSKATQANINLNSLSKDDISKFEQSQQALTSALSKLLVVVEKYPDLKANQNFLELQAQLEGTENRISVERRKFNEVVGEYNRAVRSFPRNLIAKMFNFQEKAYFASEKGSENAPKVQF
ncbi:MAG: LemA family protein [Solitalea-like symbiont of Acarus siro]